jgi:CRP-like cAMP-binding protein
MCIVNAQLINTRDTFKICASTPITGLLDQSFNLVDPKLVNIKPFAPQQIKTEITRKEVLKAPEIHLNLEAGQLLFSQGDAGGDLYFVESGMIEIFMHKNGQDIILAQMGVGEIIGVMTLLTADPRLASARAAQASVVKKIPRTTVEKLISTFPKWLNIVLKEFTARISEMNKRYSETMLELKQSRETQITSLFLATQMAQSMVIVGKSIAKNQDGVDLVFIEELLEKMELVLNQPRELVAGLWQVFVDSGLLKVEIEPERKRKVVTLERLDKVTMFTQFVRESSQGSSRKIIKAKFKYKELQTLTSLIKFVLKKGADPNKSGTFKVSEIAPDFQKITNLEWDVGHLEKPVKLGLLVTKGEADNQTLTFTPAALGRTLGCVAAMKKLTTEEDGEYVAANDDSSSFKKPA